MSDGQSAESLLASQSKTQSPAMLSRSDSKLESASTASERTITNGQNPIGSASSRVSKQSTSSSSMLERQVEVDHTSIGTTGSKEATFRPEWRKTKQTVAKRSWFVNVLKPVSGNAKEGHAKKRKANVPGKQAKVPKCKTARIKFRKHSIAHLLPQSSSTGKRASGIEVKEITEQSRLHGRFSRSVDEKERGGGDQRRHSIPDHNVLDIPDANDRNVVTVNEGKAFVALDESTETETSPAASARPIKQTLPSEHEEARALEGLILAQKVTSTACEANAEDGFDWPNSREKIEAVEIGAQIHVFWPLDKRSYTALVLDKEDNKAYLQYLDDGVSEWIDLTENWFRLADAADTVDTGALE